MSDRSGSGSGWPVILLLLGMTGVAYFFAFQSGGGEQARLAGEALKGMGVLTTKDVDRKSISAVSLATLKDRNDLSAAIALLKDLPKLTSVDCKGTDLNDAHMANLTRAKGVLSLTASGTKLTDEGAAQLASMRKLQSLFLNGTQVTEASIPMLGNLKKLRILDLSASKVSGSLEPLAGLPQLEWLLLRSLQINDESLAALGKSKSLQRLNLNESQIANEKSLDAMSAERSGITVER